MSTSQESIRILQEAELIFLIGICSLFKFLHSLLVLSVVRENPSWKRSPTIFILPSSTHFLKISLWNYSPLYRLSARHIGPWFFVNSIRNPRHSMVSSRFEVLRLPVFIFLSLFVRSLRKFCTTNLQRPIMFIDAHARLKIDAETYSERGDSRMTVAWSRSNLVSDYETRHLNKHILLVSILVTDASPMNVATNTLLFIWSR